MWIFVIALIVAAIAVFIWKGSSNVKKAEKDHAASAFQQYKAASSSTVRTTVSAAHAPQPSKRTLKKEHFVVAGTPYHKTAIQKLAKANPDWRKGGKTLAAEGKVMERIPHYIYVDRPIKLEPEPTNKHDKNAIKVMIAGEHVGYIRQDENIHVGNILKTGDIKYITAEFRGGEYKVVSKDGSAVPMENHVGITLHIGYV